MAKPLQQLLDDGPRRFRLLALSSFFLLASSFFHAANEGGAACGFPCTFGFPALCWLARSALSRPGGGQAMHGAAGGTGHQRPSRKGKGKGT